ncbi:S-layer homology domain-containing protein [Paenibacillus paridis]|uniref:S-layer homology domain-containing protein n=1 Tax=Paenibacillus paridis TaxID=2583376 RepID=UPI00111DF6E7|nr:S-layer homology domain-containing protein [Paenibacillus paridis]
MSTGFRASKKVTSIILAMLMVLGGFNGLFDRGNQVSAASGVEFAGGEGTSSEPYLIETAAQLDEVRNGNFTKYFKLIADIDLSGYAEGEGWEPIGNFSEKFYGHLDGNGFKISNLTINRPEGTYLGLFGVIHDLGYITNIGLEDIDIVGDSYAGGLAGYNSGTITSSYTTGSMDVKTNVGGLVGENRRTIHNSYSNVSVKAWGYAGGLVGWNYSAIHNSYVTGKVTGSFSGGLVSTSENIVQDSFYDSDTTGQNDTGKGIGKQTSEMKNPSTYANWDDAYWGFDPDVNEGYPYLKAFYREVNYDGNGNTGGTVPNENNVYSKNATVTVIGDIDPSDPLVKTDYVFVGWNTLADGSGTSYVSADTFSITENTTLYAQWLSTKATLTSGFGTVSTGGTATETITSIPGDVTLDEFKAVITPATNATFEIYEADGTTVATTLASGNKVIVTAQDGATKITYTVTMNAINVIATAAISGVPAPVAYEVPVRGTSTDEYTTSIVWSPEAASRFAEGETYTATLTITPQRGHVLTGVPSNFFTIAGATVVTNSADSGVVTATFPATGTIFSGGSGTIEDPYLIATAAELNQVRNFLDSSFKLTADIDLSGYAEGEGWMPIGYNDYQFEGNFDGNGYTITNLKISRQGTDHPVGLFGLISDGTVRNVILENIDVGGGTYVGGLAGANSGTITNSGVITGSVQGVQAGGGLVGVNARIITNSFFAGSLSGATRYAGGLVGYNYGTISNSLSTGSISGQHRTAGGLAGRNDGSISDSYANGSVNGERFAGALVGENSDSTVNNSYATGAVTGEGSLGGLVGTNGGATNSFYDSETTGQTSSGTSGGTGLTTANMKLQTSYAGWDFVQTWAIDSSINNGYPYLRSSQLHHVTYNGNGETDGDLPSAETAYVRGTTVSVIGNTGNLVKSGYTFAGWNTLADGTGKSYSASDSFTITASKTLFARWVNATATLASTIGTVSAGGTLQETITNIPGTTTLEALKAAITPAAGATVKVYEADGTTAASTLATGYKVIVTAQDGVTQVTYTVTLGKTVATLTSTLGTVSATGTGNETITAIPYGTTLAALKAAITPATDATFEVYHTDGITVATVLATGNKVIVTAEDGVTQVTYTVTVLKKTDASLTSTLGTVSATGTGNETITAIPSGTTLAALKAAITPATDATFEVYHTDGITVATVLATGNKVIVTAEDGVTQVTYTVTVLKKTDASLTSTLGTVSATGTGNETITAIPSGTTLAALKAAITVVADATFEVYQADGVTVATELATGNKVIVTAEDGVTQVTYTVTVNEATAPPYNGSNGGSVVPTPAKVTSKDGSLTLPVGSIGEVSLEERFTITVPTGAVNQELKLTITKLLDSKNVLINKEVLASSVYEVLKNIPGNFIKPVTLTFAFDANNVKSGQGVAIFYFDEGKREWVEVKGSKTSGNVISVEVNHFTKFAVLVVDQSTGLPVSEGTTPAELSDIAGHWAEASIKQAVKDGIVNGYVDGTFKPGKTITRAEFTVMLMKALNAQEAGAELTFTDKADIGIWAQAAVAQAVQAGITSGYQDGTFQPNANITRAEMATMIGKAFELTLDPNAVTSFADDSLIPVWAKSAVAALKERGVVKGTGANTFNPRAQTTRAEAVVMLLNTLNLVNGNNDM